MESLPPYPTEEYLTTTIAHLCVLMCAYAPTQCLLPGVSGAFSRLLLSTSFAVGRIIRRPGRDGSIVIFFLCMYRDVFIIQINCTVSCHPSHGLSLSFRLNILQAQAAGRLSLSRRPETARATPARLAA